MSSAKSEEDPVQKALDACRMTQSMIEIMAKALDGLKKQCTQTNDLIQKEILEKESKIIKLFSRQLVAKAKLKLDRMPSELRKYPNLEQLLGIIGINHHSIQGLKRQNVSVQDLLDMLGKQEDKPITQLMTLNKASEHEIKKLCIALYKLRKCTEVQMLDRKHSEKRKVDLSYSWSDYQQLSCPPGSPALVGSSPKLAHTPMQTRPSASSLYDSVGYPPQSPLSPPTPPDSPALAISESSDDASGAGTSENSRKYTPPPTPPTVKVQQGKGKFPTTPPPQKKNKLHLDAFQAGALTKSKSHDSQLPGRVNTDTVDISKYLKKKPADLSIQDYVVTSSRKKSCDTLSESTSPSLVSSPKKSPPYRGHDSVSLCDVGSEMHPNKKNQLSVPPVSPRCMMHSISHRFQGKIIMEACDLCNKHVFIGKVCKYCKMKFHKDCAAKAAPACGLPNEFVTYFRETINQGSPGRVNQPMSAFDQALVHAHSVPVFQDHPRSGSTTSSCTSSTPSSPAPPFNLCASPLSSSTQPSPAHTHTPHSISQFNFPDVISDSSAFPVYHSTDSSGIVQDSPPPGPPNNVDVINTNTSNDSDKSDKTLIDTGSSSDKAVPLLDRVDSLDDETQSLNRVNSISVTLREWDIPYESLKFGDQIGEGRFGTVYKGNWHGDVAIKMLKMDPTLEAQAQLQAFKLEVAMLRKTRHENLVLFMGACMKPPKLAIVTSLCRGRPLYHSIHVNKEKYNMNRAVLIASQIAQGMGYLHAKNIIHKDLKSKNVFLEAGKVVITDFGLFSVTKLCHGTRTGNWLSAPPDWLCYLAPEVMRKLTPVNHINSDLPFSKSSDVYAFGTIWYEIISGELPFKNQNPEITIWQVGSGMKQPLASLHTLRDVKDLLMMCWHFTPEKREKFVKIMNYLEKLPKKRLARSPSHPVQLSRSAESFF